MHSYNRLVLNTEVICSMWWIFVTMAHIITVQYFIPLWIPMLLNSSWKQGNITEYISSLIRIHIPSWKFKTMLWKVIDLWWKKIPPTDHGFILRKNRKEKAFEKRKIKLWGKLWNMTTLYVLLILPLKYH